MSPTDCDQNDIMNTRFELTSFQKKVVEEAFKDELRVTVHKAPNDAHAVLEIIYECYVKNRKAGMCASRAKSRALSRNRLEDIARIIGEPSPFSFSYPR